MTTLSDFLQNVLFPTPPVQTEEKASITDVSEEDMAQVDDSWKAKRAIRDTNLVGNLCDTLEEILQQTPVPTGRLAGLFSPDLEEDYIWRQPNPSEAKSTELLNLGFNRALRRCTIIYDSQIEVECVPQRRDSTSLYQVDWGISVDSVFRILLGVKSPAVMKAICEVLPRTGLHLRWKQRGTFLSKIFLKVAVYLGLRKLEWLFLSCHNSWIVFRLTKVRDELILAYSPVLDIANSSVVFRAYFGALLSVVRGVSVKPTTFPVNTILDTVPEEQEDPESFHYNNSCDDSTYKPSRRGGGCFDRPLTQSQHRVGGRNADVMLTFSSPNTPYPRWVYLRSIPASHPIEFFLPAWDRTLRITKFLGAGSTGRVFEGFMGKTLVAVKVVEFLRRDDRPRRQRLWSEFIAYARLEKAYSAGVLPRRIAPRCYGFFEGKMLDALVMDLHGDALSDWDDLTPSEHEQVFLLLRCLHFASIVHGDPEPRNVIRTGGGGFLLIDFTESISHACPDRDRLKTLQLHDAVPPTKLRCPEITHILQVLQRRPSRTS